jgi:endonuclease/exonuclease/phosphatase family metal-dependent hydrolase
MQYGRFSRLAALRCGIVLGVLGCLAPAAVAQTTASLTVVKDATIRGGSFATTKHGKEQILVTRRSTDLEYERRAVLTFDTETTLPAKASIQSATLVLTVRGGNSEVRQLAAYTVPISFEQEDVTWIRRNASHNWSHAGGDITGSPVTATVSPTPGSQVSFNVTTMVQRVVNGDYGSRYARFLVTDAGSNSRESYREYHSMESSTASARPRLIVTYGGSSTAPSSSTTDAVAPDGQGNLVLTPDHVTAKAGKWVVESASGALSGKVIRHPDAGMGKVTTAASSPANYFEIQFQAVAGKPYRIWLRGRADNNYWANDSVHVQFSGSVTKSGSPTWRIGTTSSTEINLEECNGCGISGWVWEDNGWGGKGVLGPEIYFASTGTHTIRVQTREDGLAVDRIILSPSTYLTTSPGGSTSSPSPSEPEPSPEPPPSSPSGVPLRVLMWNLHHGVGTDGKYDLNRIATWMAAMKPDVITLNEVEKFTSWGNEDQPARYKQMMEQKTGKKWYAHFSQEFGNWSSNGKGHLILSTYPFEATGHTAITPSAGLKGAGAASQATVIVNGRTVNFIVTHLDPESHSMRLTQAKDVIKYALGFAENRIVTGDMNAWPDQTSIAEYNKTYYDSWTVAEKMGKATGVPGITPFGATKKGRIDYIFFSKNAPHLAVVDSKVFDTRDSNGVMPSDHRPVVTTFLVK